MQLRPSLKLDNLVVAGILGQGLVSRIRSESQLDPTRSEQESQLLCSRLLVRDRGLNGDRDQVSEEAREEGGSERGWVV